jgi:hypothetical protein
MVSHRNAEGVFGWQLADAALLSSAEVVAWRAALDADPQAALGRRHDVSSVQVLSGSQRRCMQMTGQSANILTPCGAPLDQDGACSAGHLVAAAS